MGSTAHVGIDTLNIDDPNGSNGVLWQLWAPHLVHMHTSNESSVHAVFYFASKHIEENVKEMERMNLIYKD